MGETGHQLRIRVNEHLDAFDKNRPAKSAFASHLLKLGHSKDSVQVCLLREAYTRMYRRHSRTRECIISWLSIFRVYRVTVLLSTSTYPNVASLIKFTNLGHPTTTVLSFLFILRSCGIRGGG